MKTILLSLFICLCAFSQAQEFDINQPVRNSTELKEVLSKDHCILTLVLKDLYFNSITKEDLNTPNSMLYKIKLENSEVFEDDFIKLGCTKDAFLRWQKLKKNNYKLLNSIK